MKMFREVRKKSNEISAETAKKLLTEERRGVLAVNGDDGYPYAVPVNYLYDEKNQRIIFHGSRSGHKVDSIKACNKVCFTVYGNETVKEEVWAPYLQSAVVFGKCRIVKDSDENTELVRQFALKYYPDEQSVTDEIKVSGKAVQMFVIEIEHISGKMVQEK